MPSILHQDPFRPMLFGVAPLDVKTEQLNAIKTVLKICSSDSAFADKAFDAIQFILTAKPTVPPVITSISPATKAISDPAFELTVTGTGFVNGAQVMLGGDTLSTTFTSATSLKAQVDSLATFGAATRVPVHVVNPNGVVSDSKDLTLTGVVVASAPQSDEKKDEKKSEFGELKEEHKDKHDKK